MMKSRGWLLISVLYLKDQTQKRKKKKKNQTCLDEALLPGCFGRPAELLETGRIDTIALVVDIAILDKLNVLVKGQTKNVQDRLDGVEVADLKICTDVVDRSRLATMKDHIKSLSYVLHVQVVPLVASVSVDATFFFFFWVR